MSKDHEKEIKMRMVNNSYNVLFKSIETRINGHLVAIKELQEERNALEIMKNQLVEY